MSGKHDGVPKLLQQKLGHNIPSEPSATLGGSTRNVTLSKFCKKPTVAVHYKGMLLKHLLEWRWTGRYATLSVIRKSFSDLTSPSTEIYTARAFGTEERMVAVGLLQENDRAQLLVHC